MNVRAARTPSDIASVRRLFTGYGEFIRLTLGIDLWAYDYGAELDGLPGPYVAPTGCLLLAAAGGGAAGIKGGPVEGACELKRFFVNEAARGLGVGRALLAAAMEFAVAAGHRRILLDTKADLTPAIRLYESVGFRVIPSYWENPIPDVLCYGLELRRFAAPADGTTRPERRAVPTNDP